MFRSLDLIRRGNAFLKLVKPAAQQSRPLSLLVADQRRGVEGREGGLLCSAGNINQISAPLQFRPTPDRPSQPRPGYGQVSSIVFSIGIFPSHVFLYFVYCATISFMFVVLLSLSTKIVSIQCDSEIRVCRLYILQ